MNFWKKTNTDYPVLAPALVTIGVFSVFVFLFTSTTYAGIEQASLWIRGAFGHYYLYLGLASVLLLLALAISPWGKIKLGLDHESPNTVYGPGAVCSTALEWVLAFYYELSRNL